MAFTDIKEFDLDRIKKECGISDNRIEAVKNRIPELKSIYENYVIHIKMLEAFKDEILSKLNDVLSEKVHSIRARVKSPDHLIEKIIRNVIEKPDKYSDISKDNYNKLITDLLGVRVIILGQKDWRAVHDTLLSLYPNIPERYAVQPLDIIAKYDEFNKETTGKDESKISYHAEKPVVFITSRDDKTLYKDSNLEVCSSKEHYRSIHYIIKYKKIYFEIQVRTIFEEAWLEFDHRVRYPKDRNSDKKNKFISILESLALSADRLIAIYDPLDFPIDNPNGDETKPSSSPKPYDENSDGDGYKPNDLELSYRNLF